MLKLALRFVLSDGCRAGGKHPTRSALAKDKMWHIGFLDLTLQVPMALRLHLLVA
jgi:hypothetical protein